MKKFYYGLLWLTMIFIIIDLLCACLNWFVASFVFSILGVVSAIAVVVVYMVFVKHKCTKCGTIFKGEKWEIFFSFHSPTKRMMTCPLCKEKVWCEDYFESKNDKTKSA